MRSCSLYRRVPLTNPNSVSWAKQLVPLRDQIHRGWVVVLLGPAEATAAATAATDQTEGPAIPLPATH